MNIQKAINRQEFEEYKINLLKIKNKFLVESLKVQKGLLFDKAQIFKKDLRLSKAPK
ncbi:hypothetical protein KAU19_07290 [Candidatus Parcubacteria bacterium]|nr:hypothetical protein [Candidatus Parcubacteria bacterium]